MEKGLQGALDKLKSAASDLGLTIAATLLPSIRLLTKGITSAALELQAWIKEHPNWTKALGYTVGAAAALGAALLAIGSAAKVVALGIAGAKLAVTALHAAVAGAAALRTVYTMGVAAMTAANAAYTASCAAGTGAVGAFSAAVAAFMATNPVGWCLLAAGAVAALVYALDQYNTAAPRAARNADDLAAANARQRDEASRQMARLRELSNRYVLTADEMAEARRIAAQLGDQYGDLGIRFDTFAGRVDGARQALARLNDQQKRQEIADIDRQIAERADRIKEAKETNADLNSVWFRVNHPIEHFRGITDAKIHRNNDLIRSFRSQMNLLQQQRQRLTGSSAAPKTSAQANARGRISGQDFLAAQKAAEKIHVPAAPGADSAEKRIAKLQREAEAYDALMETQEKFYRQNGDGKRAAETRAQTGAGETRRRGSACAGPRGGAGSAFRAGAGSRGEPRRDCARPAGSGVRHGERSARHGRRAEDAGRALRARGIRRGPALPARTRGGGQAGRGRTDPDHRRGSAPDAGCADELRPEHVVGGALPRAARTGAGKSARFGGGLRRIFRQ